MAKNKKTMLNSSKSKTLDKKYQPLEGEMDHVPETLDEEYQRLEDEMDHVPADYSIFTKIRRKVRSLLQLPASSGGVTSLQRLNLERRMNEIEKEMRK